MENNENQKNLYQNLNYYSNFNTGINNINDPNVQNYLNQPFLPQPYMPGQTTQTYNNNLNPKNNPAYQEFNDYGFQRNILYISNLPYNTNETDIKLFFKKYGDGVTLMSINPKHFNESETAPISAPIEKHKIQGVGETPDLALAEYLHEKEKAGHEQSWR